MLVLVIVLLILKTITMTSTITNRSLGFYTPGSSKGRTAGSDPAGAGSTPAPGALESHREAGLREGALVVKRRSWLPPKEQVQVRFLAGVLLEIILGV